MLNNTKKAADRFIIFNVGRTPPDMIEHVNILNDASKEIPPLVSQLRNLKDYRAIFVNVDKIHKC